ncbi:flagellar hook-associated protein 2 [Sporomusaceae bacterium FL31]|nr:flagellar hook-associated protein 2 [Sporomusaceae bacterium FL31]GCE33851.1 flagellar hook-associated protein 2 [Sporomusaceae bacterium]
MAIRTYGLSGSGMDVDQMVKDLMKAQRARYDTLAQKKTQLEWKKSDYNTMYTAINDFRSNTAFNYKLQSTLLPKKVMSTNESIISVAANADAVNFTHSVEVTSLAQSASMSSKTAISQTGSPGKTNLGDHLGLTGTINLTLNDGTNTKSLTNYDTTGKSVYDLVSDINGLGLNVKASYDSSLDRFFLYSTKSGEENQINLKAEDSNTELLLSKLQLGNTAELSTKNPPPAPASNPDNFTTGKDAVAIIDGSTVKKNSNTFTISGVTYTLKAEGTATATVISDTDKAVEVVKSFIEAYNTTLSKINGEVNETYYKDFLPLTDAQKAEMKESEVKAWEEKAKSGLLRRDPILRELATSMRNDISNPIAGVTGNYTTASSIGITSGSYSEGGKLYLNETDLRKALDADPDVLSKIFGKQGETSSQSGLATRLYDTLKAASDKVVSEAGITASTDYDTESNLAKQLTDYKKRLDTLNTQLANTEERYYNKFNAMEVALQRLSQQSAWLAQQFSS